MKKIQWIKILTWGALVCAGSVAASTVNESYCVDSQGRSLGICDQQGQIMLAQGPAYYSLKVVLPKGGNRALVDRVLPIERLAELNLSNGDTVLLLGRFQDSMKAFRVVQRCRADQASACAQFTPSVVKIGAGQVLETALVSRGLLKPDHDNELTAKTSAELVNLDLNVPEKVAKLAEPRGDVARQGMRPEGMLKLSSDMKHVLWVDLPNGDLHVLENRGEEGLSLVETMSVSIGKRGFGKQLRGDKKTPVGVYRLLGYLQDGQLDDFYGNGAFTMNYPNALDRINKRTGSGIWLHGLPKGTAHRPLQDSDGCVVASNLMIERIGRYIEVGNTAIVLDDQLEWVEERKAKAVARSLQQAIEDWRQAWMSKDDDRYLNFYADDFTNLEKDLAAWKGYKTRINKAKRFIKVQISDLSLLGYPGEDGLVLARFYQRYESSNFNAKGWKEQLWRQDESGQWRIVYEKG